MSPRLQPMLWCAAAALLVGLLLSQQTAGAKAQALDDAKIKSLRQRLVTHYPKTQSLLDALSQYHPDTYETLLQTAPSLTQHRESAAIDFAREHHSELATLVERLRDRKSKSYQPAIRSLLNDAERLMRSKQRDPKAYPDELALWKNQSKLRLLAAKMTRNKKKNAEALESQLRELLNEQATVKKRMAVRHKSRLEAQLKRVEQRLGESDEKFVERELKRYQPKSKTENKPTSKKIDNAVAPQKPEK